MTKNPTPASVAEAQGDAVRLSGVGKSYGAVRAVDGVDLRIAPGEIVALLGPNGAGKSTTIDMLLGLAAPDSGTSQVFGVPPGEAIRRGYVGAMLQTEDLLPEVTVAEIVGLVAALHRRPLTVRDALRRAGIADLAKRRVEKLSGGQTQRVRFAMAIVSDPDLIVLDEPTAGMDVEARIAFWDGMRGLAAAGRTVLFATHYLEEADENAERIVALRSGRIVADGSTTEIKSVVTQRTIRATLPGADADRLQQLAGVNDVERRGDTIVLHCDDSDRTLRALLDAEPDARHIEVSGADLTDAFLNLMEATER